MESMVSSAPSAWLTMQQSLATYTRLLPVLYLVAIVAFILSLRNLFVDNVFDVTWVFLVVLSFALHGLRVFLEVAMERLRQLSDLVGSAQP